MGGLVSGRDYGIKTIWTVPWLVQLEGKRSKQVGINLLERSQSRRLADCGWESWQQHLLGGFAYGR